MARTVLTYKRIGGLFARLGQLQEQADAVIIARCESGELLVGQSDLRHPYSSTWQNADGRWVVASTPTYPGHESMTQEKHDWLVRPPYNHTRG